jgi:hypothetical protein
MLVIENVHVFHDEGEDKEISERRLPINIERIDEDEIHISDNDSPLWVDMYLTNAQARELASYLLGLTEK